MKKRSPTATVHALSAEVAPVTWNSVQGGPDGIVVTEEFERALTLLGEGRNVFLTGKAGTGKSTLIRRFMADTDRNVVVVAPTGIAALNVDGYTIHRLFGFRTTTGLHEVLSGTTGLAVSPRRWRRWTH